MSDRLHRRLVAAGLVVFALAYVGLGLATTATAVWVLLPLYGAFTALTDGVGRAWVVDLVPAEAQGRALGLQQGLAGGATILSGIWAGLLWADTGQVPLVASGLFAALLAVVLVVGRPDRPGGG